MPACTNMNATVPSEAAAHSGAHHHSHGLLQPRHRTIHRGTSHHLCRTPTQELPLPLLLPLPPVLLFVVAAAVTLHLFSACPAFAAAAAGDAAGGGGAAGVRQAAELRLGLGSMRGRSVAEWRAQVEAEVVHALSPPGTTRDDVPLPYIGTSVSSMLVRMDASQVRQYDGADKDNVVVDIAGQGPLQWSISRWGQGDFSPRLAPRRPYAQADLGHSPGPDGFATSSPNSLAAQAWTPSPDKGVLLASVAQNGQRWNDGSPAFYGTVACVTNSQGFGYSMTTGEFGNSQPNLGVKLGKAGANQEGNIDVAVAWFPYHQGWTGGYVDAPSEYSHAADARWQTALSHSPSLPANLSVREQRTLFHWGHHGATLQLPAVDARTDGMLFTISTDSGKWNSDLNVMSVYAKGSKWRIQAREDRLEDPTNLVESSEHMFAFLYVPFSTAGLVGGTVASNGRMVHIEGGCSVRRVSQGVYEIHLPQHMPSHNGVLLLQVSGQDESNTHFARHAFLSYNVTRATHADADTDAHTHTHTHTNTLMVEAHRLLLSRRPDGSMDETFPFVDTDFYFMWVSFTHPPTPNLDMFTGQLPHRMSTLRFWLGFLFGNFLCAAALVAATLVAAFLGVLPPEWSVLSSSAAPFPADDVASPRDHPVGLAWLFGSGGGGGGGGGWRRVAAVHDELTDDMLRGVYIDSATAASAAAVGPAASASAVDRGSSDGNGGGGCGSEPHEGKT